MSNNLSDLHSILDDIVQLLDEFNDLLNCHLVNFITKEHFDNFLPENIKKELLHLTDAELCQLPSGRLNSTKLHNHCASTSDLTNLVARCHRLCLPSVLENTEFWDAAEIKTAYSSNPKGQPRLNQYMGVKKSHEVEQMACAVASVAADLNISCAVDIGSGRGYLSSLLAMYFGMNVLGFDISDGNTQSAQKRQSNLAKHWKSVLKRVQKDDAIAGTEISYGSYIPITCKIDNETNLSEILSDNFGKDAAVIVCGLHTCGDLAANSINMFLKCPQAKCLCLVGCCYHLIEEKFVANPFRKPGDPDPSFYGFPLSFYLTNKGFKLGRNARILASQPVNRMADNEMLPNVALYWRALLQKIVHDKFKEIDIFEKQVGSIAKSCNDDFSDYLCKALRKLDINLDVSYEEAEAYLAKYANHRPKMNAFFQFRCIFAPVIETAVVLDRLCYLLEQNTVNNVKVMQLFNPTKSPRCYALFANKA